MLTDVIEAYERQRWPLKARFLAARADACVQFVLAQQEAGHASRFFRVSHNRTVVFDPLSAIFPGHVAPVVRQTADGEREIVLMKWGFVLPQRDKAPRRVTNVLCGCSGP